MAPLTNGTHTKKLVRHGETVKNAIFRLIYQNSLIELSQDQLAALALPDCDTPLTPTGILQAQALRPLLAESPRGKTRFIVSPYLRALHTFQHAFGGSGVEMVVDERVRERSWGNIDAYAADPSLRHHLAAEGRKSISDEHYGPFGGESMYACRQRVREALLEYGSDGKSDVDIYVTHGDAIRCAIQAARGLTMRELHHGPRSFSTPNCGIVEFSRFDLETGRIGESWKTRMRCFYEHPHCFDWEDIPAFMPELNAA